MSKKFCFGIIIVTIAFSLFGCANNNAITTDSTTKDSSATSITDTTPSSSYSSSSITSHSSKITSSYSTTSYSSKITNYCEVDGCYREGSRSYAGITGQTEYYCYTHYNEIFDMITDMEEDVEKSTYNKHTCEECSREGTYSIVGITGSTEYYCLTHYNELKDLLEMFQ